MASDPPGEYDWKVTFNEEQLESMGKDTYKLDL